MGRLALKARRLLLADGRPSRIMGLTNSTPLAVCAEVLHFEKDTVMADSALTEHSLPESLAEEVDLSRAHVLLVDDNVQNLELMQAYLESLPCRLTTVTDGVEATKIIESDPPDLILLDVMMPRMSGFELCQNIKGNPHTRDMMVIMVTASASSPSKRASPSRSCPCSIWRIYWRCSCRET